MTNALTRRIPAAVVYLVVIGGTTSASGQNVITIEGRSLSVSATQIAKAATLAGSPRSSQGAMKNASRADIRKLAQEFGLMKETRVNPHLAFLEGDLSYWYEQQLSDDRLRLEFAARRAVLDAADNQRIVIADQGKLSWAAQQIAGDLQNARLALRAK